MLGREAVLRARRIIPRVEVVVSAVLINKSALVETIVNGAAGIPPVVPGRESVRPVILK